MNIQPASGKNLLRSGAGKYQDQLEEAELLLSRWEKKGFSGGAGLFVWPVGIGKTPAALRVIYALKQRLTELGDPRANLPSIVVCDRPTKWQWADYTEKWIPEWNSGQVLVINGDKAQVAEQFKVYDLVKGVNIIVLNYDKVVDYLPELMKRGPYLMVCLDEPRRIKNSATQRNQSVDSLDCSFRLGLDGTPMTKEPDSLYHILSWLMPGKYKSRLTDEDYCTPTKGCYYKKEHLNRQYTDAVVAGCKLQGCPFYMGESIFTGMCAFQNGKALEGKEPSRHYYHEYSPYWGTEEEFRKRYCQLTCPKCGAVKSEVGWAGGDAWCGHAGARVSGAIHTEELRWRLEVESELIYVINRSDIPGFPTVTPVNQFVKLTPRQSQFYREAESGLLEWLDEEGGEYRKDIKNLLAQIAWLRSCATLPPAAIIEKLKGGCAPEWLRNVVIPAELDGGKQIAAEEFVASNLQDGDKIVLFSEWTTVTHDMVRRLEKFLAPQGKTVAHINGSQTDPVREKNKREFNHNPDCVVMVASPAGNAVLNLHESFIGRGGNGTMFTVNIDTGWIATEIEQRTGRVQRYGFDGEAIISIFFTAVLDDGGDTIDSRMMERVLARAKASDLVTGTNLGAIFNWSSAQDVMKLLGR